MAQAPIVIATIGETLHGKFAAESAGSTKKMAPTARKARPPAMVSQRATSLRFIARSLLTRPAARNPV